MPEVKCLGRRECLWRATAWVNTHSMSHLDATSWAFCTSLGRRNSLIHDRNAFGCWINRPFSNMACHSVNIWCAFHSELPSVQVLTRAMVKIAAQFACVTVSVLCRGRSSSNAFISANKQHYLMKWGGVSEGPRKTSPKYWRKSQYGMASGRLCWLLLNISTEN